MDRNKIAAVTILFHPPDDILKNIRSYLPFVDLLFLIDNSPAANPALATERNSEKVIYIQDGENKGIACRLNEAARMALDRKADWLLTMDQDSYFDPGTLSAYLDCAGQYPDRNKVAVFGTAYEKKPDSAADPCSPQEAEQLITSGSLVNLAAWKETGGFDERLFIDEVDHEYCLRSILKGFKIIRFPSVYLNHSLGNILHGYSLKSLKKTPRTLHAPLRIYYMVRNYFYVRRHYQLHFRTLMEKKRHGLLVTLKNNLLYGNRKMQVLRYIAEGYLHFKQGRMGKYPPE